MSVISWILIAVCAFIVLSIFIDRRNTSGQPNSDSIKNDLSESLIANEAQPTGTGRFRVQQMLQSTRKMAGTTAEIDKKNMSGSKNEPVEEVELPDPFKK